MKTLCRIKQIKSHLSVISPPCAALLSVMVFSGTPALAGEGKAESAAPPATRTAPGLTTNQSPSTALSPGISEILEMADARVSAEVIKTYVECSSTSYQPTGAEIITLKKHDVADEVVTLLLKRGAQVRSAALQARNGGLARALSPRRMASGGLDPDSYDYFQYYYLQPRALASVYQTLSPYYYPSFPYR